MPRPYDPNCPVGLALDVVGERWTLLVLRELRFGAQRFQDFLDAIPGLSPAVLSARLKLLEEHGVVERRLYSDHPPRFEYVNTEKGRGLAPVLLALRQWGAAHYGQELAARHAVCGCELTLHAYCSGCGCEVPPEEVASPRARAEGSTA